ncbi:glycosyltransferase 87 family protein [Gordonia shandongensis]|uniref:glycosyltransferase 87 family protein n=1 Tax=Gordonia shandongensis TaxID=376351 RepID=UPI0003FAED8B|nr:glycosyltransferase 87 family protein [Gordonia shandongensis]
MKLDRSTPVVVGFLFVGLLAIWVQHALIPYTEPYWGLFQNYLDLDVYRAGAQVALDGGDLYDAKLLGQMDFTYAPVSVIGFAPFAWMSAGSAHLIWTIAIFAALYLVIVLSFRSLGHEVTWRLRVVAVSLVSIAAVLEPVRSTIWFGQINVFLMLVVIADLLRPGGRLRGVATGVAGGIKLTPMIYAVYLAATRQWRAALGVVGGFAASVAVGFVLMPSASVDFWFRTMFDSDRVSSPQTNGNQSIRGAIANVANTDHPSALLWIVLSAAMVVLAGAAAVLAHRRGWELLALSIVGMASCAVSPVAWSHHWVWLVPLLVIVIHLVFERLTGVWRAVVAVVGVGGVLAALAWRTHFGFAMWFANRSVREAYFTGLFFKHPDGFDWFTSQPFVVILVVTAVATIAAALRPRSAVPSPSPVV